MVRREALIFLRNSSPVIGDENMPKVPSVAPIWPSADVVAQQSVRVMVLKPARMCVAAMALNTYPSRRPCASSTRRSSS